MKSSHRVNAGVCVGKKKPGDRARNFMRLLPALVAFGLLVSVPAFAQTTQ
jgi:hypothetical protein